jgi:hypothetical protein
MKNCPPFLSIKEMTITLKFHLTPVRMTIKKTNNNQFWQELGERIPHTHTAGGNANYYNHCGK